MKQLFGFLLLVGLILVYWKIIAVVLVVAWLVRAVVRAFPEAWEQHKAERLEKQRTALEISARADLEHAQVMAGDPAGTYGMYQPAGERIGP